MSPDPQADAFVRGILRQPDDTTARLVFADWLDERGGPGDEAWAQYIRAKDEAAKHADGAHERKQAERIASAAALKIAAKLTVSAAVFIRHPRSLVQLLPPPRLAVKLGDIEVPQAVVELVPESVARENLVLPLRLHGRTMLVAAAEPWNGETVQKLDFILNKDILMVSCAEDDIRKAIGRHYGLTETESVDSVFYADPAYVELDPPPGSPADPDSPVARLLALILAEAINAGADRVLFVSATEHLAVRHRTPAGWVERDDIPLRLLQSLVNRTALLCGWHAEPPGGHFGGEFRLTHAGFVFVIEANVASGEFGVGLQFDIPHRFEMPEIPDVPD